LACPKSLFPDTERGVESSPYHDRVPGKQSPRDFDHQDDHWDVPRRNCRDDGKRFVQSDHLPHASSREHVRRQIEHSVITEHSDREGNLEEGIQQRSALFLSQKAGELMLLGVKCLSQLD
jgi:hypothetical protein